jgi:hypothetical protein
LTEWEQASKMDVEQAQDVEQPTMNSVAPAAVPIPDIISDSDEWEYEYSTTETEVNDTFH